jgi:hypothetical protein
LVIFSARFPGLGVIAIYCKLSAVTLSLTEGPLHHLCNYILYNTIWQIYFYNLHFDTSFMLFPFTFTFRILSIHVYIFCFTHGSILNFRLFFDWSPGLLTKINFSLCNILRALNIVQKENLHHMEQIRVTHRITFINTKTCNVMYCYSFAT